MLVEIPDDVAAAIELLIDNNVNFIKPSLLRSVLYTIAGKIPGPSGLGFTADPPLYYDVFTNKFNISQASSSTDGFLSKEDFLAFSTGGSMHFIGIGEVQVFKNLNNNDPANKYVLEVGDVGQKFIFIDGVSTKIEGVYKGGDPSLPESWTIQTSIEP